MKQIITKALYGDAFNPENFQNRPRVSAKIREYLVELIQKEILEPKKIIVTDKFSYRLTFSVKKSPNPNEPDGVLYKVRTIKESKEISFSIYSDAVIKDITPITYVHLLVDGLKVFLTEQYKKITPAEVEAVREKIDVAYINSLPFPAPFEEQDYIYDASPNVKTAYIQEFGF